VIVAKKEAALDRRILSPLYPRGFIGAFRTVSHHTFVSLKRMGANFAPAFTKSCGG
jgi:hypothetical protein